MTDEAAIKSLATKSVAEPIYQQQTLLKPQIIKQQIHLPSIYPPFEVF